ncbi:MAG: cobalamin-dependent protein [Pseudomonadota bacterium]
MSSDQLERRRVIENSVFNRIIPALLAKPSSVGLSGNQNIPRAQQTIPMATPPAISLDPDAVKDFARLLLTGDAQACEARFVALRREKVAVATLFLDLLAPASVLLGEAWLQDEAGFGDVTVGMSIVHGLMRRHSDALADEINAKPRAENVYIFPLPLGQHVFGASMVEEFFRAHGWGVHSGVYQEEQDVLDAVHGNFFDVVGISFSVHEDLQRCKDLIADLRQVSENEKLIVMAGGAPFVENPDLVHTIGADMTAANAGEAVERAQQLVTQRDSGVI